MSLNLKKKKKIKQQIFFKNIETIHEEKMKYFESLQNSLPKKNKQLALAKKKKQNTSELENEIERILNREEETDYFLLTHDILRRYFEMDDTYTNTTLDIENLSGLLEDNPRDEISREYYYALGLTYPKYIKVKMTVCDNCNTEMKESDEKYMVCHNCGVTERDPVLDGVSYKDIQESNASYTFNYKRINYFIEWLNQIQANEKIDIEDEILDEIKRELKKRRIVNDKKITHTLIKNVLKQINRNKYYEHIPLIISKLCGSKPLNIPLDILEKMKTMFMIIQHPFDTLKDPTRINFFSYPYIFYKFSELLGLHDYLSHFSLLKSREKLINQDILWKRIVDHVRHTSGDDLWRFIPSC